MSLVINHNLTALNTTRNLNTTYNSLSRSVQRLSTGLRINSAADDAAGLAIREGMRSEIASLSQGVRNAQDGISLIQTAEGAMAVIDEKLIRMKELAEQAATGTYTDQQRLIIHSEFSAMAAEIDRIVQATDFNGVKLLDGNISIAGEGTWSANNRWILDNPNELWTNSSGWQETNGVVSGNSIINGIKIHFGSGNSRAEDYYFIRVGDMSTASLGVGADDVSLTSQHEAQSAIERINTAIIRKENARAYLGGIQNRLENTITNLQTQIENLQASESRISDMDMASEMTEFVKNQVLAQAGVAMLAQANSLPQMALRLLG
ncbi:MAG: flagellin [Candidatus Cloacimonetes bacterium]|nr:flagellin [Candidatus Cloacimonadota bacterium]